MRNTRQRKPNRMQTLQMLQLKRLLLKVIPSFCMLSVFLICLSLVLMFIKKRVVLPTKTTDLLIPVNQLERSHISREQTLDQIRRIISRKSRHSSNPEFRPGLIEDILPEDYELLQFAEGDAAIVEAMGFTKLAMEIRSVTVENENLHIRQHTAPPVPLPVVKPKAHLDTARQMFCLPTLYTPQGTKRKVDPAICPQLLNLFEDIENGVRPPLLTLFTWLPDPIADVERLSRRIVFTNLDLFRPFIQPVLFTDHRINMALANIHDWPCLPVPAHSEEGIPVFRNMSEMVMNNFPSTFYGYVSSTTVFDVSMLETLIAILNRYATEAGNDRASENKSGKTEIDVEGFNSPKPVLVYGKAENMTNIRVRNDFYRLSEVIVNKESCGWEDKKNSLVYFLYKGIHFHDIPPLVVNDKFLTSFIVARSTALGHVVVDASYTILAIHNYRNSTKSEWNREYLKPRQRDPFYNKRLTGDYLDSLQSLDLETSAELVTTKFAKNGSILFDIRFGPLE